MILMWGSCGGFILFKIWFHQTNKNQKQIIRNVTHSKIMGHTIS